MATVRNVLDNIAAYINQDPTLVTGTDLTMQINLINQSQDEWAVIYQWKDLRKTITPSVAFSGTSLALPQRYSKLMSPLYDYSAGISSPYKYYEVRPEERFLKTESDRYIYHVGNDAEGHALIINPPLMSGASLCLDIQVEPSSLATLTDTITCPSVPFLTTRTISKILSARSDPRFPQVKADSDDLMAQMIEEEEALSGGFKNQVQNAFAKASFRIGQD